MSDLNVSIDIQRVSGFKLQLDLLIKTGEITALYGPSGSGKSTVLNLIAGLEKPQGKVDITIGEQTWVDESNFLETHNRAIGYVTQRPALFPHLNVMGNLQYAKQRRHRNSDIDVEQVSSWLNIKALHDKPVANLSGGEQQRVAIARALLSSPSVMLMDEPLGSLDRNARNRILPFINQLHEKLDFPFLYVTHEIEEVAYLTDTIYLIDAGSILHSGSTFELASSLEMNKHEGDAAASILLCEPISFDQQDNLTALQLADQQLLVRGDRSAQSNIRLRIPAREVSLTLSHAQDTSILNILAGTVSEIGIDEEANSALVKVKIGDQFLLSRITHRSLKNLALEIGQSVYAQIKSVGLLSDHVDAK